jgi:Icc-related predicted phosphoesterase
VRILASADLHGDRSTVEWLVRVARERRPDALVLAGDLLGVPEGFGTVEEAQAADAAAIAEVLTPLAIPVLFVMGNDDLVALPDGRGPLRSIHGRHVELGAWNVVGYQNGPPFMNGPFERPEAELGREIAALADRVDERTVLVTHYPARAEHESEGPEEAIGLAAIRDLVVRRQPRAHVHGHAHRAFGRRGIHFNVAAALQLRAMLIDLESLDHEAVQG